MIENIQSTFNGNSLLIDIIFYIFIAFIAFMIFKYLFKRKLRQRLNVHKSKIPTTGTITSVAHSYNTPQQQTNIERKLENGEIEIESITISHEITVRNKIYEGESIIYKQPDETLEYNEYKRDQEISIFYNSKNPKENFFNKDSMFIAMSEENRTNNKI